MRRSTSATGVPVSACFSANAICSSVNLLFFTAPLLPSGSHKTGKLAFKPDEKNGRTSPGHSGPRIRLKQLKGGPEQLMVWVHGHPRSPSWLKNAADAKPVTPNECR